MLLICFSTCVFNSLSKTRALTSKHVQDSKRKWKLRLCVICERSHLCEQKSEGAASIRLWGPGSLCRTLGSPSCSPLITPLTWGKLLWLCSSPSSVLHLPCWIKIKGSGQSKKRSIALLQRTAVKLITKPAYVREPASFNRFSAPEWEDTGCLSGVSQCCYIFMAKTPS